MSVLEYSEKFLQFRPSTHNVHHCKICPYFSTSIFLMVNHARRHRSPLTRFNCETSDVEVYSCKDCSFRTYLTVFLRRHIESCHSVKRESQDDFLSDMTDDVVQNYICEKCSFETHFVFKWLEHTAKCWKNNKSISLQHLDIQNIEKFYLKYENAHDSSEQCSKWYRCTSCSYKAKHKTTLSRHVNRHHVNGKYINWHKCQQCPYKAKIERTLQNHMYRNHWDKKQWYECKSCPYKAKNRCNLTTHVNRQHRDSAKTDPKLKEVLRNYYLYVNNPVLN